MSVTVSQGASWLVIMIAIAMLVSSWAGAVHADSITFLEHDKSPGAQLCGSAGIVIAAPTARCRLAVQSLLCTLWAPALRATIFDDEAADELVS